MKKSKIILIVFIFIFSLTFLFFLFKEKKLETPVIIDTTFVVNNNLIETKLVEDSCIFNFYKPMFEKIGLDIGEKYYYESYINKNTKYILNLTRIEKNIINADFHLIMNNSIYFKINDTLICQNNDFKNFYCEKYNYNLIGKIFESSNKKKEIQLFFDPENAKYALLKIGEPLYLTSIPLFTKKSLDEPFQNYLLELIDDIHSFEGHPNRHMFINELKDKYNKIELLLNHLDSNNYNYNYKTDESLLNKTKYYGLDSLSNIFVSKGIISINLKNDSSVLRVNSSDINCFTAIVRKDINNKILSNKFECISFSTWQKLATKCKSIIYVDKLVIT